jgi:penicillin-binding protein 2
MMNRLLLPKILVLLTIVVLVGRLYQLQLIDTEASRFRYATEERTTHYLPVRPLRGEIFASDGRTLLAESVPIFNVSIRPAELDRAAPRGSPERAEIFAHLSQLLGVTSTLTISPAATLERDASLRSDLAQGIGQGALESARVTSVPQPLTLRLPPAQAGAAAALLRTYPGIVRLARQAPASLDGATGEALDTALAGIGAALELTTTLTISPAASLRDTPALRDELRALVGDDLLSAGAPAVSWATLDVPANRTLAALRISQAYSASVILRNPLQEKVDRSDIPGYQTLILKQDIPRHVALVLRENAPSLPGVVIEQDYRRRYPQSAQVPSLSHVLGYIGRISQCELVSENTARSWITGLLDTIGNAAACRRIIPKQIVPEELGRERYLNDDRIGKDGLEASYEDVLRGRLGSEAVLVDVLGRPVRAPQTAQQARDGENLVLTIDVPFQRQVEQILKNWIAIGEQRRESASGRDAWKKDGYAPIRSGVAIVMEVNTGRVLAMVSWPGYDNNVWVDPTRTAELQDLLAPSDPAKRKEIETLTPLLNRAIAGQYPPGSTLKQFDAAIALQEKVITPETKVPDPGRLVIEDEFRPGVTYTFPNSGAVPRGEKTVSDALMVSSNVFFMSVAGGNKDRVINLKPEEQNIPTGLKIDRLAEGLGWFGLGQPTGVRLAGEAAGRVPTPAWKQRVMREAWTTGDTYNAAIGQGNLEVTPLQLVTAGAAIANNGTVYRPQLVKAITDAEGRVVQAIAPEVMRRVPVDPRYFSVVREGMRRSVTEGVNRAARDACSGLAIAGKTGTAEFGPPITVTDANGKTRIERQTHSWFVGFAPYDNPQIEVVVLSEGTGSLGDGAATIAVPAVTQIMQAYFNITPPTPLPRECQQGLPPLPPRIDPGAADTRLDLHERRADAAR